MKTTESFDQLPPTKMSDEQVQKLVSLVMDLPAAVSALPEEEQQMYEACQQSIVDARRAAYANEGQIFIT